MARCVQPVFELLLQLFLGDFDLFFRGNAVDHQFRLCIILGAVFLAGRAAG